MLSLALKTNSSPTSAFTKKLRRPISSSGILNSSRHWPNTYPVLSLAMPPMAARKTITIYRCIRLNRCSNTIHITLNERRSTETTLIIKTSFVRTMTRATTPVRKAEQWTWSTPPHEPPAMAMNKSFIPNQKGLGSTSAAPSNPSRSLVTSNGIKKSNGFYSVEKIKWRSSLDSIASLITRKRSHSWSTNIGALPSE